MPAKAARAGAPGAVTVLAQGHPRQPAARVWQQLPAALRRWSLWLCLLLLLSALLVLLVWLARRFDAEQIQAQVDRDAQAAVSDIRSALARNVQTLQSLHNPGTRADPSAAVWAGEASRLLRAQREWLRLEWRDPQLQTLAYANSPYRLPVFDRLGRANAQGDVALACAGATRRSAAAYAPSYYVPLTDGLGVEVMDLCLPLMRSGQLTGYYVASYSLKEILAEKVGQQLARNQELSFTEADGARLAVVGSLERQANTFTSRQLLDLPGNTVVLRLQSWRSTPSLFPNVLTALVSALALTLLAVLVLLARDTRRRMKAEHELAEALAFRKAMEDSLVTGLRARDLQGRITYVNPAFCQMVGFAADELLGHSTPAPYWPPEFTGEYQQRQAVRLAGHLPPREGHESLFMRKDGSRFPVLIIEAPLINATGKQTGWMSAFLDISEQRRMEDQAKGAQDRMQATARLATVGEMASLLSHELNQPLASIASYAHGAMNVLQQPAVPAAPATALDAEQGDALQVALQRIAQQAERAGKVIASVQDLVRRRERPRAAARPHELLASIMPLVSLQARKLRVRLHSDVPADLPLLWCDRTLVEQALLNLALNGMQAMQAAAAEDSPKKPEQDPGMAAAIPSRERVLGLTVAYRALSRDAALPAPDAALPALLGWMHFSVSDTGPGIAEAVARQLYTPFFTTKSEGMGLGLALCRSVVEQHGGVLEFDSCPGHGTTFHFTLPVHAAPAGPVLAAEAALPAAA
ncbi:MAG: two-component system sensor histidine kinase NtrB [Burkholderiaceae bacterium]